MSAIDVLFVPLLRKTRFNLQIPANQTNEIILADRIDTTRYASARLILRYYAKTQFVANSTFLIGIRRMSIAPDEPQTDFVESGNLATVDLDSTNVPPHLEISSSWDSTGPATRVVLVVTGTTAGQIDIAIGLDLQLRTI